MNERIKELAEQAGFDPDAIQRMGVMPQAEKFAELIVRECMIKCIHYEDMLSISQHFGVE